MKHTGTIKMKMTALFMALILSIVLLPGKVSAEPQTWISFDSLLQVTGPEETDLGQIYTAGAIIELDSEGSGTVSYTVDGAKQYGHPHLLDANGVPVEGASVEEANDTNRTAKIRGLEPDTAYQLFWDKDESFNKLSVDVYLIFHTEAGESSGEDTPTQNWITFDGNVTADVQSADAENGIFYQAADLVPFNSQGQAIIQYSVDGSQKYCHPLLQDENGVSVEGASVDEPNGTSRTATISGLEENKTYRLFWNKDESNGSLLYDVYLIFHTAKEESGETPSQNWITFNGNTDAILQSADAEAGIVYQAYVNVPFNSEGQAVITYSVDGAQKYCHPELLDANKTPVTGASVDEPDATNRTAAISGLEAGTTYFLFWDKEKSNGKLSYNVYLQFTVGPDQNWMTLPNAVYSYSETGGENDTDYYEAVSPLEFNMDGAIVYQYSVLGGQKKGHIQIQDATGGALTGVEVDEPDAENRTATILGLSGNTVYRFFWDKNTSNDKLRRHVVLSFTTGALDEDILIVTGIEDSYDYTGEVICPEPIVQWHGEALTKGTDYEVTYSEDVVNAGKKALTVTGLGDYAGKTVTKEYTIKKASLEAATITLPEGTGTTEDGTVTYAYTGSEIKPEPVVTLGSRTLTKGVDYQVSYYSAEDPGNEDFINASSGAKLTVEVFQVATGNYVGGAAEKPTYTIVPKEITPTVTLSTKVYTWNGNVKKPSVTVKDGSTVLNVDTDYTVSYASGRKNVGTYKVTVKTKGNYKGSKTVSFTINPKKINPSITLSTKVYTWNGNVKKPSVTVKDGSTVLKANTDYTVSYPSGRKNVGSYKITVKLKGNYSGTKAVTFRINPKGTTLKSLTPASKAITVKWTKQADKMSSVRISGYQIQRATDSAFTKNKKTTTVSGYSNVSCKLTGLTSGKNYYVRIRTYKTINDVKYYSSWSKAQKVKTK